MAVADISLLKSLDGSKSVLVAVHLKNFMGFVSAVIPLHKGITSLTGLNNRGKSSTVMAIEIIGFNSYASIQNQLVHDNATCFDIGLEFSDGVFIRRVKGNAEEGYRENYYTLSLNGSVIYDTRQNNVSLKLDGQVPEVIVRYLGFLNDPISNTKLTVRRNKDKLFAIETTGGENYKSFNEAFKIGDLSLASSLLTSDKRARQKAYTEHTATTLRLQSEYRANLGVCLSRSSRICLETLRHSVRSLLDRKLFVGDVSTRLTAVSAEKLFTSVSVVSLDRYTELCSIVSLLHSDARVHVGLSLVDTLRYDSICALLVSLTDYASCSVFTELKLIDGSRYRSLLALCKLFDYVSVSTHPVELSGVDTQRYALLSRILSTWLELESTEALLLSLVAELDALQAELKQGGLLVCDVCGGVVDISHIDTPCLSS